MKDITTPITADLIAEWKELKAKSYLVTDLDAWERQVAAIAAELDTRATKAGLSIVDGFPTFAKVTVAPSSTRMLSITVPIAAAEINGLLGWLLLKKGVGG